jgi:hypothetical protein
VANPRTSLRPNGSTVCASAGALRTGVGRPDLCLERLAEAGPGKPGDLLRVWMHTRAPLSARRRCAPRRDLADAGI